jgi:NADPH-dependent curcumin reductase CurA
VLDLGLGKANPHAKFVICDGISQYNTETPQGPKKYLEIVRMRTEMEGFVVFDYQETWKEARTSLARRLDEGKLQTTVTVVKGVLVQADKALVALYVGVDIGRTQSLDWSDTTWNGRR